MKVLLPVDGSVINARAARYLVKHWPKGAQVTLLNVDMPLSEHIADYVDAQSLAEFHADRGNATLTRARRVLTKAGHIYDEKLLVGDPGIEIIEMAKRGKYDLIVMGSHGRGALKSLFLGSVVIKVLANSTVPVLVIR
jgi:nucleotide-binding universal stress UspA family protein